MNIHGTTAARHACRGTSFAPCSERAGVRSVVRFIASPIAASFARPFLLSSALALAAISGAQAATADGARGASAAASAPAAAGSPADERERIARERAEVRAAFAKQEAACRERFVVTPCIDAARRAQREALSRLNREEAVLGDEQRRERAAQRARTIRERISADDALRSREAARAASAARPAERGELAESPGRAPHPLQHRAGAPETPASAAERQARERESVRQREEQRRALQAHREAVEQRNARRAASGKAAAPLPVPSGASMP